MRLGRGFLFVSPARLRAPFVQPPFTRGCFAMVSRSLDLLSACMLACRGKNIDHMLVDGMIPTAFPDGIPPIPGGTLGTPTSIEAAKINNLLRTNPQRSSRSGHSFPHSTASNPGPHPTLAHSGLCFRSSLAQLIDFPVVEGTAPRSESAMGGLDALLAMLRAKTATDLLDATSRLQEEAPPTMLSEGREGRRCPSPPCLEGREAGRCPPPTMLSEGREAHLICPAIAPLLV